MSKYSVMRARVDDPDGFVFDKFRLKDALYRDGDAIDRLWKAADALDGSMHDPDVEDRDDLFEALTNAIGDLRPLFGEE